MSKDPNKEKRQAMQTCRGYANNRTPCRYSVEDGKKCCTSSHEDMENYTEEEFANQQKCSKCKRYRYIFSKNLCRACYTEYYINRSDDLCKGMQKTNPGELCRIKPKGSKKYCKNHDYMNSYTEDELKNMKQCTSCDRMVRAADIPEGYTTCERDRNAGKKNREDERNKEHKICKKEECPCKAQDDNDY